MIRCAAEMKKEIRTNMRGGVGDVEILHIFSQEEMNSKCRLMAQITLPPGASIGMHEHSGEEEVYYIVRGEAEVTDAGITKAISAGDSVLTGNGNSHSIKNIGEEPLVFMASVLLY